MTIEGIPDGWELVRVGHPVLGVDTFLGDDATIVFCSFNSARMNCVIIRKIERPKTYRPFANAAEFKPHRDRWVKFLFAESDGVYSTYRVVTYDDWGAIFGGSKESYGAVFNRYVFDNLDGTTEPFGVEVTE